MVWYPAPPPLQCSLGATPDPVPGGTGMCACPAAGPPWALLLSLPSPGWHEPTDRSSTEAENVAAMCCGCLGSVPRARRYQGTSKLELASWCPTDASSARVCAEVVTLIELSVLNCPLGSEIELVLVWNCQQLVNFKFSGFQLLINRGIYHIIFLKFCHGI